MARFSHSKNIKAVTVIKKGMLTMQKKQNSENRLPRNPLELTRDQNFIEGKIDAFDLLASCAPYGIYEAPRKTKPRPLSAG